MRQRTCWKENGIDCFISNENMASVYPMFDSNLGGVRLHLFEKDVPKADRILSDYSSSTNE